MDIITKTIRRLGITSIYRGYHYVIEAIQIAIKDEDVLLSVCKNIYPPVAEKFKTTPSSVECNLRTVIDVCWERGNRTLLSKIFLYPISEKPTVSEFIDSLAVYCKAVMAAEAASPPRPESPIK